MHPCRTCSKPSLSWLLLFIKDPAEFDVKNPAGFNIAFYLDPHAAPAWLVSLGSSIDVFSIWVILLLATGMAAVSRKSWKSSLLAVVAPWAVYVIGKVLWAAIAGSLGLGYGSIVHKPGFDPAFFPGILRLSGRLITMIKS